MSSEVEKENSKDEESSKEQPTKTTRQKLEENWQIALKILELFFCCICLGFAFDSVKTIGLGNSEFHHVGIMYTAYTGYILINLVFIASRILGDNIPYRTSALFSLSASALFLITGVVLLVDCSSLIKRYSFNPSKQELSMITISSIFAIINSVVFAFDAIVTFRRQEDF